MPEDRMLERLEKLEGIVETTVQILPPLINDLSRRIDDLREEVQEEKGRLRKVTVHYPHAGGRVQGRHQAPPPPPLWPSGGGGAM
jgi:alkanesulfonate monooxygenase SsuD/methylene tetrahydromethanopterin reductase-like flavin-dependent oxidoreductase (luciferase family)